MKLCDSRIRQFCIRHCLEYRFRIGNRKFLVQHGDRIVNQAKPGMIKFYSAAMDFFTKVRLYRLVQKLIRGSMRMGYFVLGADFMTSTPIARKNNQVMKDSRTNLEGIWLICSDTHFADFDRDKNFINTGCILYGRASYLLINGGKMELIKESY